MSTIPSTTTTTTTTTAPASLPAVLKVMQNDHRDSYLHHTIRSPSPTQQRPITADGHEQPKQAFRLPSIAELRLDLSLDEFEAQTALGSLSSASLTRPPIDHQPQRGIRHRRRDSWGSPSTSSNVSIITNPKYAQPYPPGTGQPLAPPPPYHLYQSPSSAHGHESVTSMDPTHSPDYTNQYRFRVSASSSAATSPSLERPSSRALPHYPPYSRSHSRTLSSSRPTTSATTTTQSYPHSQSHPPSSFPFIAAAPPRITPDSSEGEPRRKRRKYEEIERRYLCGWNGCSKAYGTLNHLNDHVSLQGHGPKRRSSEFA